METSNLDSKWWNSSQLLPQCIPLSFAAHSISPHFQCNRGFPDKQRDFEGFGVYYAVDEHHIQKHYVVHDAEDGVVIEVGNCGVASHDAHTHA